MKQSFPLIVLLLITLCTACKKEKESPPPPPPTTTTPPPPTPEKHKQYYPYIDRMEIKLARPLKDDTTNNFISSIKMSEKVNIGTARYPKYEVQPRGYFNYTSDTTIKDFSLLNYFEWSIAYNTSWNNAGMLSIRTESLYHAGFIFSTSPKYSYWFSVTRGSDLAIVIDYGGKETLPTAFVMAAFNKILIETLGVESKKNDFHYVGY